MQLPFSKCTIGYSLIAFLGTLALYNNPLLAAILAGVTLYATNRIEIEKENESFRANAGQNFCCLNKNGQKCYDDNCPGKCDCVNPKDITSRSKPGGGSLAAQFLDRGARDPKNFFGIY